MDLSILVNGIKFPNPFLLGSGPPGTNARVIAIPSAIAGIIGFPFATAAALFVSNFVRETSRHDLEVVRDIRVPGGEIIYDREMRRLHLKKHARS